MKNPAKPVKYKYKQSKSIVGLGKSLLHYGELQFKRLVIRPTLYGFAVLFKDGRTEYWAYDPGVLNKNQIKMLGIHKFKPFKVEIK